MHISVIQTAARLVTVTFLPLSKDRPDEKTRFDASAQAVYIEHCTALCSPPSDVTGHDWLYVPTRQPVVAFTFVVSLLLFVVFQRKCILGSAII